MKFIYTAITTIAIVALSITACVEMAKKPHKKTARYSHKPRTSSKPKQRPTPMPIFKDSYVIRPDGSWHWLSPDITITPDAPTPTPTPIKEVF